MRAISAFRPDDGTITSSWAAWMPLRIRVRKSAIGSVIDMRGSPARSWMSWPSASQSPKSRRGERLDLERLEPRRPPVTGERHAECREERERLRVGLRARRERHVEAAHLVDVVVVDLREDDLLPDAHRVVAPPVEGPRVEAAEV